LYGLLVVVLAHLFAQRVRSSNWASVALNKIAGTLLIGFGLKLALSK
jgi:threonine/homoserine/homoserine lactone efflux protein